MDDRFITGSRAPPPSVSEEEKEKKSKGKTRKDRPSCIKVENRKGGMTRIKVGDMMTY